MAMTLETMVGANNSNSFITVAQADTYLSEFTLLDTSAWDALTDAEKTERVWYAGMILKNRYTWLNWPVYENQAMPFPRWYLNDDGDETYVGGGTTPSIPDDVKKAQALIALNVVHRGASSLRAVSTGKAGPSVKSLKLFGSLDITVADSPVPASDTSRLDAMIQNNNWIIDELLAPYHAQVWIEIDSDSAPDLEDEFEAT